jgi:phosphinothricin acetyltransferase
MGKHGSRGARGTSSALYTALFERLRTQPIHVAVAAVALPNEASLALHRTMGFWEVGTFEEYARKHDTWISSTWLQRRLS